MVRSSRNDKTMNCAQAADMIDQMNPRHGAAIVAREFGCPPGRCVLQHNQDLVWQVVERCTNPRPWDPHLGPDMRDGNTL